MNFSNLAGQQELRLVLGRALVENKISHAILFTGPSGSGKKSWGKILARSILCSNRSESGPCMECISCRSFLNGNHPDYFYLEPGGRKIKIEQLRAIRDSFYLSGGRKVCLIDQAERMTAEASSSLLKILEDPPADMHFILLAEQPRLLFDTILSRCQRYKLNPLSCAQITELLMSNKGTTAGKAALLGRISGGLPGYAYRLADDERFEERYEEAKAAAWNLASGCDSTKKLLSLAASMSDREDLVEFLELVCLIYRDWLVQSLGRGKEVPQHTIQPFAHQAGKSPFPFGLEEAIMIINTVINEMMTTNVNRRLLLEKTLILLQRRLSQCPGLSESASGRLERHTTSSLP